MITFGKSKTTIAYIPTTGFKCVQSYNTQDYMTSVISNYFNLPFSSLHLYQSTKKKSMKKKAAKMRALTPMNSSMTQMTQLKVQEKKKM